MDFDERISNGVGHASDVYKEHTIENLITPVQDKIRASFEKHLPIYNVGSVLELGSGDGGSSIVMLKRVKPSKAYITDFDKNRIRLLKELAEKNSDLFKNAGVYWADAREPFTIEGERVDELDLILMANSIHLALGYQEDPQETLEVMAQNWYDMLRPGGVAGVSSLYMKGHTTEDHQRFYLT